MLKLIPLFILALLLHDCSGGGHSESYITKDDLPKKEISRL